MLSHNDALVAIASVLLITVLVFFRPGRGKSPPQLLDPVPGIFNSVQFIFNNARFMERTSKLLKSSDIGKFYLMFTPVFVLSGTQNIQTLFTRSANVENEVQWLRVAFPGLYKMHPQDIRRFADDRSGRDRQPVPGTEGISSEHRYWYGFHNVHGEYLSKSQVFRPLARRYGDLLSASLDESFPLGHWKRVSLIDFCHTHVAQVSVEMLFGPKMLALSPDLLEAYWAFDKQLMAVSLLPRWLARDADRAQARYHKMLRAYVDDISRSSADTTDRLVPSKILDWVRAKGFHEDSVVGTLGALIFALLSNTVPITTWTLFEILSDPCLLRTVREEVETAYIYNPAAAAMELNIEKLVTLPTLQSVFTEVLRLHMSFNILRNVRAPFELNGFSVQKGNMLTAPIEVAHYDEQTWGDTDHPAHEFWADRHVGYRENDQAGSSGEAGHEKIFVLEGKRSAYYPFGGGSSICPGRHLAKSEVLTTVALVVSRMDIELEGWKTIDGRPSERRARNDPKYSGVGAVLPDRDLQCLWRRRH